MSCCSCMAVVTIPLDYETGRYRRGLIPICISDTDEYGQQIEWRYLFTVPAPEFCPGAHDGAQASD
jgi:hypothetical protein